MPRKPKPTPSTADATNQEISRLTALTLEGLRQSWIERWNSDPPPIRSRELLRRLFAWRLQSAAFGNIGADLENDLEQFARSAGPDLIQNAKQKRRIGAGAVLIREWKGIPHTVVAVDGGFELLGKKYRSLSDVARHITGTRWSGPRFFGLEQKSAKPAARVSS